MCGWGWEVFLLCPLGTLQYLERILSRLQCHAHGSDRYSILHQALPRLGFRALERAGELSLLSCAIPVVRFLGSSQKSLHTASLLCLLCTLCLSSFPLPFVPRMWSGKGEPHRKCLFFSLTTFPAAFGWENSRRGKASNQWKVVQLPSQTGTF